MDSQDDLTIAYLAGVVDGRKKAAAEIERLTEQVKHFHDLFHHNNEEKTAAINRKDAALRVAATALIDAGMYARKYGDELLNVREALATIKEAL